MMVLVYQINKHRVSAVIRREFDNLTPQHVKDNREAVEEAQLDELNRWHKLEVFRRKPRHECKNLGDGTWVLKWKSVKDEHGRESRIVKARLTAIGFKDMQAYNEMIATFSGTATKAGQRAVCGHAAQHEYEIFSMDFSAAFLKGLTFEETAKMTNKPMRSVQFAVPTSSVHLLRKLPGMGDFHATRCSIS